MDIEQFAREFFENSSIGYGPLRAGKYKLAVPGYSKEDLDIKVSGRQLIIKSADAINEDLAGSSFTYCTDLADSINVDDIKVKLKHGLLSFELVNEEEKTIKIEIE